VCGLCGADDHEGGEVDRGSWSWSWVHGLVVRCSA
jgi:hypothetical protein